MVASVFSLHLSAQTHSDTITKSIGYTLYYPNGVAPKNITFIGAQYHQDGDNKYVDYKYINHDQTEISRREFTPHHIDSIYQWHLDDDRANQNTYDILLKRSKKEAKIGVISDSISKYLGYWVYLEKYNNQYYLADNWDFILSFKIEADKVVFRYMDGPMPCVIESFRVDDRGDFILKMEGEEVHYGTLIDPKRGIYEFRSDGGKRYITRAQNYSMFDVISYANNTGDLIFPW